MEQTQDKTAEAWKGGDKPYNASYGKLMMWFFLITDALTFSGFLASYGFSRFKYPEVWPNPEDVFSHFPFLHGDHPLLFVALMTFILIMSSVTMVLAVNYGHKMQKNKVILWLSLTIVGGAIFLGSQAWEWGHFIHGDKGGVDTKTEFVVHIAEGEELASVYTLMGEDGHDGSHHDFSVEEVISTLEKNPQYNIRKANREYLSNTESIDYLRKISDESVNDIVPPWSIYETEDLNEKSSTIYVKTELNDQFEDLNEEFDESLLQSFENGVVFQGRAG